MKNKIIRISNLGQGKNVLNVWTATNGWKNFVGMKIHWFKRNKMQSY